jgi:arsenate reductase-like glutaredoxin family protein
MSCIRAQEFLARQKISPEQTADAKKNVLKKSDALKLAAAAKELYSSRHNKVVHVNLAKEKPDEKTLSELMLGPTGNLRAPTLKVGDVLLVGFNEETYKKVLG